jgi:hypothetical protein
MPDADLSKRPMKKLIDDLGADDVEVRDQAQRELIRRILEQPNLDDEFRALLPGIRDPEVDARLRGVLTACRYYIRVCSVVAFPRSDWWEGDVEFRFGTGASAVATAPYHLEAGEPKDLGPFGIQVFNSAQHRIILDCGETIEHELYAEVIGLATGTEPIRHRCLEGKRHINWVEAAARRFASCSKLSSKPIAGPHRHGARPASQAVHRVDQTSWRRWGAP